MRSPCLLLLIAQLLASSECRWFFKQDGSPPAYPGETPKMSQPSRSADYYSQAYSTVAGYSSTASQLPTEAPEEPEEEDLGAGQGSQGGSQPYAPEYQYASVYSAGGGGYPPMTTCTSASSYVPPVYTETCLSATSRYYAPTTAFASPSYYVPSETCTSMSSQYYAPTSEAIAPTPTSVSCVPLVPSETPSPCVSPSQTFCSSYAPQPAPTVCPYNLTTPYSRNVTMVYRLENVQKEYFFAKEFCQARGAGLWCYTPRACEGTNCLPTAILSCPDVVFIKCRDLFVCGQTNLSAPAQCLAMIDMLPQSAWQYGRPKLVFDEEDRPAFDVPSSSGATLRYCPTRCVGPNPRELEKCLLPASSVSDDEGSVPSRTLGGPGSGNTLPTCDVY